MKQLWTLVVGEHITVAQQPRGGLYISNGLADGGAFIPDADVDDVIKALQKHKRGLKPKKPAAKVKPKTEVPAQRVRRVK